MGYDGSIEEQDRREFGTRLMGSDSGLLGE
jgi:hypothetical protein